MRAECIHITYSVMAEKREEASSLFPVYCKLFENPRKTIYHWVSQFSWNNNHAIELNHTEERLPSSCGHHTHHERKIKRVVWVVRKTKVRVQCSVHPTF